jgi:hypothetical protein
MESQMLDVLMIVLSIILDRTSHFRVVMPSVFVSSLDVLTMQLAGMDLHALGIEMTSLVLQNIAIVFHVVMVQTVPDGNKDVFSLIKT